MLFRSSITKEKIECIRHDIATFHENYEMVKAKNGIAEPENAGNIKLELIDSVSEGKEKTENETETERIEGNKKAFEITIGRETFTKYKEAGEKLIEDLKHMNVTLGKHELGSFMGLKICGYYDLEQHKKVLQLCGKTSYEVNESMNSVGIIRAIVNCANGMNERLNKAENRLHDFNQRLIYCKQEVNKPFPQETEYQQKKERLAVLDRELNMDEKVNEVLEEGSAASLEDKISAAAGRCSEQSTQKTAEKEWYRA